MLEPFDNDRYSTEHDADGSIPLLRFQKTAFWELHDSMAVLESLHSHAISRVKICGKLFIESTKDGHLKAGRTTKWYAASHYDADLIVAHMARNWNCFRSFGSLHAL